MAAEGGTEIELGRKVETTLGLKPDGEEWGLGGMWFEQGWTKAEKTTKCLMLCIHVFLSKHMR